jgi:hypothetical protein
VKTFILEDDERRAAAMLTSLRDAFPELDHVLVGTAPDAVEFLEQSLAEVVAIALDHDLPIYRDSSNRLIDAGTGREVADFLCTQPPRCTVVLHSTNGPAVVGMREALESAGWKTTRVVPYGDLEWIEERWFPEFRAAIEHYLAS